MSESVFSPGDVVQLKSGGPKMTVEDVSNYGYGDAPVLKAKCHWFEGPNAKEAVWALPLLKKVE